MPRHWGEPWDGHHPHSERTGNILAAAMERLVDVHFAQVDSHLRFSGLELGLLLNVRTWPLKDGGIKRVIRSCT